MAYLVGCQTLHPNRVPPNRVAPKCVASMHMYIDSLDFIQYVIVLPMPLDEHALPCAALAYSHNGPRASA